MYGLVLEGGGAKGAYHVGAYKALQELGIEINGVAGTSIGALNAAMIVQGDIEQLEDLWNNVDLEKLFGIDNKEIDKIKKMNLIESNIPYLLGKSKEIIANKGLDTAEIRNIINSNISEERLRNSKMDFGLVTVSLSDLQPLELLKENIPEGKVIDYLMASCNLPAFKLEKIDGKFMVDGGYYDNLPFNVLMGKGYKHFIAVRTYGIGMVKKVNKKKADVIYIEPVEDLGGTIYFEASKSKRLMKQGYYDTIKVFQNLKGFKYYIRPFEKNFLKFILKYFDGKDEKILEAGEMLGFKNLPANRMLFEKILPRVQSILEYKNKNDYEDIIIRLVEYVAEKYNDIDRFRIYEMKEFVDCVCDKYRENPLKINENVPGIIRTNKLLALTAKDDVLISVFKRLFI